MIVGVFVLYTLKDASRPQCSSGREDDRLTNIAFRRTNPTESAA
jgi:hypothetical protein